MVNSLINDNVSCNTIVIVILINHIFTRQVHIKRSKTKLYATLLCNIIPPKFSTYGRLWHSNMLDRLGCIQGPQSDFQF